MYRNSHTPAMKAPTKHRSMNATNRADRLVELRRMTVAKAQAPASVATMKRTRMDRGVSWLLSSKPLTNQACISLIKCLHIQDASAYQHADYRNQRDNLCHSPKGE